jgi:hypothetical protein
VRLASLTSSVCCNTAAAVAAGVVNVVITVAAVVAAMLGYGLNTVQQLAVCMKYAAMLSIALTCTTVHTNSVKLCVQRT